MLSLEDLERDKATLEQKINGLKQQNNQNTAVIIRLGGALGYIEDNIKLMKEEGDDE